MKKFLIALGIVSLCIILGLHLSQEYIVQVKPVSEGIKYKNDGEIQLYGEIVDGSFRIISPNTYAFELTDGKATVSVIYAGELPSTFKEGIRVTLAGEFNGSVFRAYRMLTKCPSKYEQLKSK